MTTTGPAAGLERVCCPTMVARGARRPKSVLRGVLQLTTFVTKAYFVGAIVAIWIRWTLPRIRVDQMMVMCWKYLVPIAFVNLLAVAVWMVVFPTGMPGVRFVLFAFRLAKVGYVVAVRETSIVLSALIGTLWLREGRPGPRLLGAAIVLAGVTCVALAR